MPLSGEICLTSDRSIPVLSHWSQQARRTGLIALFERIRWPPIAPTEAILSGDQTEVSRRHSRQTPGVMAGTGRRPEH